MTYKLITEPRLARAIKALESYDLGQIDEVLDILRAVQEREGPKLYGTVNVHPGGHQYVTSSDNTPRSRDEQLYLLPEEPK